MFSARSRAVARPALLGETERTVLRALSTGDRDEFLDAMRSSRALHHPWASAPVDGRGWQELLARAGREDFEALLACRREDGAIAGFFNLSQIFRGAFQNAYLGYAAAAPLAGRGHMTEGLDLTLRHAFETMRLHRVEANIQPGNARSLALVQRCAFRREGFSPRYLRIGGIWRDHERWAITVEDWRAD